MTAREFLTKTFQLAGILASNEALSASEASDGLVSLNELIESWSVEGLMIPTVSQESFSLVASQASYTIGSSGNFNTTRPINIENASVLINGTSYQLDILNSDQRAELVNQSLMGLPTKVYYDKSVPTGTLYFYPIPDQAYSLRLSSSKPIGSLASLDTGVVFQPGYARALRYSLAIDIAPEYGRELSQVVMSEAFRLKADLKRKNIEPTYMKSDYQTGRTFNINTGE